MSALISSTRAYEVRVNRNNNGIVSRVSAHYGSVRVQVQGEGDHPNTRRARARAALREALGSEWEVTDYRGATLITHCNANGERYGSLHMYGAARIA